jgi:hypothetical protein
MSHDPGERNHGVIDSGFDQRFLEAGPRRSGGLASYSQDDLLRAGAGAVELLCWIPHCRCPAGFSRGSAGLQARESLGHGRQAMVFTAPEAIRATGADRFRRTTVHWSRLWMFLVSVSERLLGAALATDAGICQPPKGRPGKRTGRVDPNMPASILGDSVGVGETRGEPIR